LTLEGVTPRKLDDDISEEGPNNMEWESDLWEAVDHEVEWSPAAANFKVITGMRSGEGGAMQKMVWGQREALLFDAFDELVLDKRHPQKV
jgi:hypothetical protein